MAGMIGGRDAQRMRTLATFASVGVALVLIVAKLAAYLVTASVSILSSLIDSCVDLMASAVTLYGVMHAQRPADRSHRYGHGKAEPLAALAQAAFVTGSAVFLSVEAVQRIVTPQPIGESAVGLAVMGLSIALTTALVLFQHRVIARTGSMAIDADSLHYRGDLLANLAVIAAILLTQATGLQLIDSAFALVIAAVLVRGAWRIAMGALDVLMDRELPAVDRERIAHIVLAHEATRGMHDLRTRSSGDRVFVELHLELDSGLTLAEAHDITDAVEARLRAAFPTAEILIHQEPEGLDDERLDHLIRRSKEIRKRGA